MPRMPATHSRSNAFTPPPSSGETGIMSDLYRLSVGPLHADYYQQQFNRFETLGKAVPSWNTAAAFCTLAWMVLRKLWRPAAVYAAVWVALLLLWVLGLHGRVPLPVEATIGLLTLMLLCAVPGFLGNGWYYHHVRNQTLTTLTAASSLAQARVKLSAQGVSTSRLQAIAAAQAVTGMALGAALYSLWSPSRPASSAPSGPPNLVIPSPSSIAKPPAGAALMEPALPDGLVLPNATAAQAKAPVTSAAISPAPLPPSPPADTDKPPVAAAPAAPAIPAPAATASTPAAHPATTKPAPSAESSPRAATPPAAAKKSAPPPAPAPVKAVAPPTPPASKAKPATTAPAQPEAPVGGLIPGKYYLNAGVYAQAATVDRAAKQLQAAKLNTLRQTVNSNKGEMTRLRIGPFDTRQQAEQAAAKAQTLRIQATVFQQPKK